MTAHLDFGDGLTWSKSSRSGDNGGNCLYVAHDSDTDLIGVRDSKYPTDPPQWYTRAEWTAFLDGAKAGDFDII